MAGVETPHQGGARQVAGFGTPQDERRKCGGGQQGQRGVEQARRGETPVLVFPAGQKKQAFADAQPGKGVERMVDLQARREGAGGVFQRIEEKGGPGAGPRPDAPDSGVHLAFCRMGWLRRNQQDAGGGNGKGGKGEIEDRGAEPEPEAAADA